MPKHRSMKATCVWKTMVSSVLLQCKVQVGAVEVEVREISRNNIIKEALYDMQMSLSIIFKCKFKTLHKARININEFWIIIAFLLK